jgi:hypothetical protein
MNYKLKGRTLLHGDVTQPETVIAEFSDKLTRTSAKELVAAMNYGHDLLMLYKQHRDNLHVVNVVTMLQAMESVYKQWDAEVYNANSCDIFSSSRRRTD